jgi:uncharacterized protein (DUF342 family)
VSSKIPHIILATATPMQKEPGEYHSLLKLLGLPKAWQKNIVYMNKLLTELNEAKAALQQDRMEFNQLHQELLHSKHSCVDVRRDIFPGVTICISDMTITTKDKRSFCRYEKKNGEIQISTL